MKAWIALVAVLGLALAAPSTASAKISITSPPADEHVYDDGSNIVVRGQAPAYLSVAFGSCWSGDVTGLPSSLGIGIPMVDFGCLMLPLPSFTPVKVVAYRADLVTGAAIGSRLANIEYTPDYTDSDDWEMGLLPLADGRYRIDGQHCCSSPSQVARSFWVDTVPPTVSLDSATPPSPTNSTTRTFTFSGNDPAPSPGFDLECSLDGGPWTVCTSPYTTPTLAEGNHTFSVRAKDKAGHLSSTESSSWLVDTTKPTIDLDVPVNRARYVLDEVVNAQYTCDDPFTGAPPTRSGLASCVGNVPNGSPIDTSTLGPHIFTVTARDHAGNEHVERRAYTVEPPRYADLVLEDHPIAYWRLGDALGSATMADSSGHGRYGRYQNGIALKRPGAINCARRPHPPLACDFKNDPEDFAAFFPARDGHAYVNDISAPQTAYALEAWIKTTEASTSIAGHGGGGQLFLSGGRLALRQTQDTVTGGPAVNDGAWHHVGASWDGSVVRLYVDGVQVATSAAANKSPSGTSTFYVGYGDQAPWFHGTLDEVAYYDHALSADDFKDHHAIGTVQDKPSLGTGPLATARPYTDAQAPASNALYAPTKVPAADFECHDLDGDATIVSCTATVDGQPIDPGDPLPAAPGDHVFVVSAEDQDGLTYAHIHRYTVKDFASIVGHDLPIAYFRLGDGAGDQMTDASPNGRHGTYKNRQESGPVGIAGDGDTARRFFGRDGYGYVPSIPAPRFQATLSAWVNPVDGRDASIAGHGDAGELLIRGGRFAFRHMDTTVTASVGPVPGSWSQVVGVWDGQDIVIYVDGVERGRTEATKRPSSASTFYVGYGELAPWFAGAIDEVSYYDVALSAARVYQHYLADPPPDGTAAAQTPDTAPGEAGGGASPAASSPAASTPAKTAPKPPAKTAPAVKPVNAKRTAAARKKALKRCKAIGSSSKRKACVKRANRIVVR